MREIGSKTVQVDSWYWANCHILDPRQTQNLLMLGYFPSYSGLQVPTWQLSLKCKLDQRFMQHFYPAVTNQQKYPYHKQQDNPGCDNVLSQSHVVSLSLKLYS